MRRRSTVPRARRLLLLLMLLLLLSSLPAWLSACLPPRPTTTALAPSPAFCASAATHRPHPRCHATIHARPAPLAPPSLLASSKVRSLPALPTRNPSSCPSPRPSASARCAYSGVHTLCFYASAADRRGERERTSSKRERESGGEGPSPASQPTYLLPRPRRPSARPSAAFAASLTLPAHVPLPLSPLFCDGLGCESPLLESIQIIGRPLLAPPRFSPRTRRHRSKRHLASILLSVKPLFALQSTNLAHCPPPSSLLPSSTWRRSRHSS